MKPLIGWVISIGIWIVCVVLLFIANHNGDIEKASFFNILQLVAIGFMWVFLTIYNICE